MTAAMNAARIEYSTAVAPRERLACTRAHFSKDRMFMSGGYGDEQPVKVVSYETRTRPAPVRKWSDSVTSTRAARADWARPPRARPVVDAMPTVALLAVAVLLSTSVTIGADALWLVTVGEHIITNLSVPVGFPAAPDSTQGWVNVPVLGELVFAAVDRIGPAALPILQVVTAMGVLWLVSREGRLARSSALLRAGVIVALGLGALPSLGVLRAQVFSLGLMAVLLVLLRRDEASSSRRIWFIPLLLSLWGNLHGAVLVGLAVTGCYLAFHRLRRRPLETVTVGTACVIALWVNPVGLRSLRYYAGIIGNEAARRRDGLWAPLNLGSTFDILMVVAAASLAIAMLLRRPSPWRLITAVGLAGGTVWTSRNGVWLLLVLAMSALAPIRRSPDLSHSSVEPGLAPSPWPRLLTVMALAATSAVALATRAQVFHDERTVARQVVQIANGRSILAPEPLVEAISAEGGSVVASNPIDAFPPRVQAAYLDVWAGRVDPQVLGPIEIAVVSAGSPADVALRAQGFVQCQVVAGFATLRPAYGSCTTA